MAKFFALAIAGLSLVGFILAIALSRVSFTPIPLVLGVASLIGFIGSYKIDRIREQKEAESKKNRIQTRIQELCSMSQSRDFTLAVKGSSGIGVALLTVIVGAIMISTAFANKFHIFIFSAGALLLLASLILLMMALSLMGKPLLVLSRDTISTPLFGTFNWQIIDGVFLRSYVSRGGITVTYTLMLKVLGQPEFSTRPPFVIRFTGALRRMSKSGKVNIVLNRTDEQPEVIVALAKHLWSMKSGKDYNWDPSMSDEYNATMRKLSSQQKGPSNPDLLLERLRNDPAGELERVKTISKQFSTITAENKRVQRKTFWLLMALVALTVALAIVKIVRT